LPVTAKYKEPLRGVRRYLYVCVLCIVFMCAPVIRSFLLS